MHTIAKTSTPIHVIVHSPKTTEGQNELKERVANVHSSIVNQYIKKLNCSSEQKVQLLNAIIKTRKIDRSR